LKGSYEKGIRWLKGPYRTLQSKDTLLIRTLQLKDTLLIRSLQPMDTLLIRSLLIKRSDLCWEVPYKNMTFGGSGLIKGMAFDWRDFIRMSFGGRGLMKRSAFSVKDLIRRVSFG
jgi:hypothetical protein